MTRLHNIINASCDVFGYKVIIKIYRTYFLYKIREANNKIMQDFYDYKEDIQEMIDSYDKGEIYQNNYVASQEEQSQ